MLPSLERSVVSKSQIAVFCLIVALLPFPTSCGITYGFPAIAAAESDDHDGFSPGGMAANVLFAVAMLYVILRLGGKGLFNLPWRWGVYAVLLLHGTILLTWTVFRLEWMGDALQEPLFDGLYSFLAYTVYLPATLIDNTAGLSMENYDFIIRASYVVMMGAFFCLGAVARMLWDRWRKRDEFEESGLIAVK